MGGLRRLAGGAAAAALIASPATADTLRDALVRAYRSNPTLSGARAEQRQRDEDVRIAAADQLPQVSATGDFVENTLKDRANLTGADRQVSAAVTLSVPVYQGGAVRNAVRAANARVNSGLFLLRGTEAQIFAQVVTSYMDVIRDEAIVGLNRQNVRVLEVNLQASRDRFEVGDLTRTDVAQSEARLAIARGTLQSAEAQLIASREGYIEVVGAPPGRLEDPPNLPHLPDTPDQAVDVAMARNPNLLAAQRAAKAAGFDVGVANGQRLPRVSATVGGNYFSYLNSYALGRLFGTGNDGRSATAGVNVTVPLYQGGRPAAQVRQAQDREQQAIEQVTETERAVIANARSAYAQWRSSLQVIASSETAVNANKLSLEGVRAENSVGNRTILDILNAEQELLNSQVNLVTAQHDAYVAGFTLLAVMGEAEARDLGLDGGPFYDPLIHYRQASRSRWDWGNEPNPVPVATSTAATPAQTAVLTKPLDPILDTKPVDRNQPLTTGADAPNR